MSDSVREAVQNCSEHIFLGADTAAELIPIERCVERKFKETSEFRYENEDASFYEIRNVRNVRVFQG